jgi:hypothetical protein
MPNGLLRFWYISHNCSLFARVPLTSCGARPTIVWLGETSHREHKQGESCRLSLKTISSGSTDNLPISSGPSGDCHKRRWIGRRGAGDEFDRCGGSSPHQRRSYWIDDVAAREACGRDHTTEFRAEGLDASFESVKSKFRQGFILLSTNQTEPPNLCVRKSQPDQARASVHPPSGEECRQPQP